MTLLDEFKQMLRAEMEASSMSKAEVTALIASVLLGFRVSPDDQQALKDAIRLIDNAGLLLNHKPPYPEGLYPGFRTREGDEWQKPSNEGEVCDPRA
jgi:hypothetical protein